MKLLIAGLFAFSGAAFAANIAPVSYHDGILVFVLYAGFRKQLRRQLRTALQ
jgi:hypothetical protein